MTDDLISRKDAIRALKDLPRWVMDSNGEFQPVDANTISMIDPDDAVSAIENLRSVTPEQDIAEWMLAYHLKSFDLKGRYLPHEVISWLINDFAKVFLAERRE